MWISKDSVSYTLYNHDADSNSICSQCDNGSEFKGALEELCKKLNVKIIHGAPYKPATQGSVESANRTFKRRLQALQAERGTKDWVSVLPQMAIAMNQTRPRGLPVGITPFEVHFGRKPHWESSLSDEYIVLPPDSEDEDDLVDIQASINSDTAITSNDIMEDVQESDFEGSNFEESIQAEVEALEVEDAFRQEIEGPTYGPQAQDGLTALERRIMSFQETAREKLIAKSKQQNVVTFKEQEIATLHIPAKLRRAGEAMRLPVRIFEEKHGGRYTLISSHGRLAGNYTHGDLNKVAFWTGVNLGCNIPTGLPETDFMGNVVGVANFTGTITLNVAVQLVNNRDSIRKCQIAGRANQRVRRRGAGKANRGVNRDAAATRSEVLRSREVLADPFLSPERTSSSSLASDPPPPPLGIQTISCEGGKRKTFEYFAIEPFKDYQPLILEGRRRK